MRCDAMRCDAMRCDARAVCVRGACACACGARAVRCAVRVRCACGARAVCVRCACACASGARAVRCGARVLRLSRRVRRLGPGCGGVPAGRGLGSEEEVDVRLEVVDREALAVERHLDRRVRHARHVVHAARHQRDDV
eukprot:3448980-Prymnesium_polylepis.1